MIGIGKKDLGFWIPLVIFLAGLADGLLRLVPLDYLAFRAWEAVSQGRAPSGPFAPLRRYRNPFSSGDLATFGNLPQLRQFRDEVFTTDRYGFRNSSNLAYKRPIAAVVLGDSFAVGSGVTDSDTLPAQLASQSGQLVYNAAGVEAPHFPDLQRLGQRLQVKEGLFIYVHLERQPSPSLRSAMRPIYTDAVQISNEPLSPLRRLQSWGMDLRISRLEILCRRARKSLDEKSGNDRVILRHLENGEPILFLPAEVASSRRSSLLSAEYWIALQRELARYGHKLLVILVPNKYTVYAPLLREKEAPLPPSYLDNLAADLNQAQVPVINLRPDFAKRAAADLKHGELLYWKDDTHWNSRGIAVAAQHILNAWQVPPATSK